MVLVDGFILDKNGDLIPKKFELNNDGFPLDEWKQKYCRSAHNDIVRQGRKLEAYSNPDLDPETVFIDKGKP